MLTEEIVRRIPVVLLIVLVAFVVGCQKKPVAIVDGEEITEEMVERQINASIMEHGAQGVKVDPKALRHVAIEQLIAERLLLQGAKENDIKVSDDDLNAKVEETRARRGEEAFNKDLADGKITLEKFKARLREKMMVTGFIASLAPEESVTEDDIVRYYKESPTPFLRPEEVNIKVIQVHHEEQAEAIAKEIEKEKDFDKVASILNEKKGAVVIGYGWTTPGVYDPTLAEAMRNIKVGDYSGPHKGTGGYYLFKIKEKKDKGVKSLDEARDEIKTVLLRQARQSASMHWVADRKKIALIKID
jgi:peptidyl-prolyl cis-trans isomerase SurA